jgi:hypothetical protein
MFRSFSQILMPSQTFIFSERRRRIVDRRWRRFRRCGNRWTLHRRTRKSGLFVPSCFPDYKSHLTLLICLLGFLAISQIPKARKSGSARLFVPSSFPDSEPPLHLLISFLGPLQLPRLQTTLILLNYLVEAFQFPRFQTPLNI